MSCSEGVLAMWCQFRSRFAHRQHPMCGDEQALSADLNVDREDLAKHCLPRGQRDRYIQGLYRSHSPRRNLMDVNWSNQVRLSHIRHALPAPNNRIINQSVPCVAGCRVVFLGPPMHWLGRRQVEHGRGVYCLTRSLKAPNGA